MYINTYTDTYACHTQAPFLMALIHVTFKLRIRRSRLFGMSLWTYQAVKSTVAT